MTETPRPEKWATIRRLHLNAPYGSSPAGQYWYEPDAQPIVAAYEKALAEGDAARAADAARHQQEIAAKDAELDKLRVFLGDASPKSDALRRQFDAEIATLRATVEQQAARLTALEQALRRKDAAIQAFLDLWPIAMEQINGAIVLQSLRAGRDTYTGPNLGPQIEALRQALETAPQGGSNG